MRVERDPFASNPEWIDEVVASAHGPEVGAFFDLDRTLIRGYSGAFLLWQRLRSGRLSARQVASVVSATTGWLVGRLPLTDLMTAALVTTDGLDDRDLDDLGREIFDLYLERRIYPEAMALIEAHRAAGHTLAIISSATRCQVAPVARHLDVPIYRCTRLAFGEDFCFGTVVEPACCGEGKADAGRELADVYRLSLDKSFFYTDSLEDLPLLDLVGHPRPVNPSPPLRQHARERGWPTARFHARDRSRPSMRPRVRERAISGA
jgi:putative phosphoserine phosphatase/1-acylglycerol-3-phosphate O-acyltransferase